MDIPDLPQAALPKVICRSAEEEAAKMREPEIDWIAPCDFCGVEREPVVGTATPTRSRLQLRKTPDALMLSRHAHRSPAASIADKEP
jgi:hypothetical protein